MKKFLKPDDFLFYLVNICFFNYSHMTYPYGSLIISFLIFWQIYQQKYQIIKVQNMCPCINGRFEACEFGLGQGYAHRKLKGDLILFYIFYN